MESINYARIAMSDIEPEARRIAVAWVEGFEKNGSLEIEQKVKLASDIMNYAIAYHKHHSKQTETNAVVMPSLPSGFEIKLMPNEVMREGVAVMLLNPKDYEAVSKSLDKRGNGA